MIATLGIKFLIKNEEADVFKEIWSADVNNELSEEERQFCLRIRGANDKKSLLFLDFCRSLEIKDLNGSQVTSLSRDVLHSKENICDELSL